MRGQIRIPPRALPPRKTPAEKEGSMALIYIVEDDVSIREIETIALKNSNYLVHTFERASDFFKKVE